MSELPQAQPIGAAALRLRGDPPRVMRLSRKTLAVAGLVVTAGIGGALIYALQPTAPKAPNELYETDNRAASDALAGAPKDYSQVPRLGPPLPGDLGKPILSAQQRGVDVPPPPNGQQTQPGGPPDEAQAARDRIRQERDAARTSKMFIGSESAAPQTPPGSPAALPAQGTGSAAAPSQVVERQGPASGQPAKRDFVTARNEHPAESSHRLVPAASPYIVQAGSVIPAALITGIRSDLPGIITAQVTQNVYDSVAGRHLLIPQGSRLIGEYDSQISFGQNRVLLAWDRLILPDGRSVQLDRLPGTDASGYSGLQDRVDQHWGGLFRAALISTLLSVGTEVGSDDEDSLVRALREGTSDSIGRTGQDLVRRQMNVQPTLTVRAGFQLRVIVTRDLVLAPGEGGAK
ncbi:TrbI/VirB10 family protein [Sphingomonas sp. HF-S4]|uniref:TrbI/VirB10 family protein n=2 Tax=Sphingomonas TaxID=13687 RepID=A0A4U1L5A4_9SPHN|nr:MULTISPECIES: TrbI/VirB10 family protein [Sphingomonas]MDV3458243.1 TrbI/VirB10 family protein [Sphingomonas sp. HF-S4]TKD51463.1 TrbI/VirB10 family protein [Sphingomonas baiyangensis]